VELEAHGKRGVDSNETIGCAANSASTASARRSLRTSYPLDAHSDKPSAKARRPRSVRLKINAQVPFTHAKTSQ